MNRRNFFRLSFGAAMAAACAPLAAALLPASVSRTYVVGGSALSIADPTGAFAGYYNKVSIETLKVNVLLDVLQRDVPLHGALARQGLRVDPTAIRQLWMYKLENTPRWPVSGA